MAKNIRKACNKRNLYFTIRNEVRKEVSRILDSDGGSKNHPQVTEENTNVVAFTKPSEAGMFGHGGLKGLVFTPLPTDSDTESELETTYKPSLNIDSAMPTPVRITLEYETEVDGVSVIPSYDANEVMTNTLSHMRAMFG